MIDASEYLKSHPLIGDAHIETDSISIRHFLPNEPIYDTVDDVKCVGFILYGHIDVFSLALDGKDIHLTTLHENGCFGISNLVKTCALQTTLVANTEVTILFLPKDAIMSALQVDAAFCLRYTMYCNDRIQFLLERIKFLTIQTAKIKLITFLLSESNEKDQVHFTHSREDLAKYLGIGRATLFRELGNLQKQNLLEIEKEYFLIKNKITLKQMAYENA